MMTYGVLLFLRFINQICSRRRHLLAFLALCLILTIILVSVKVIIKLMI